MKKKLVFKLTLFVLTFVVLAISGVALAADVSDLEVKDLTPWKGNHEPFVNLYRTTAAEKLFVEMAKYAANYTPEMAKEYYLNNNLEKFKKISIPDGETVIFDDNVQGKYNYLGKLVTTWGEYEITWYIFKTFSQEAINAGFKYLLMMPYHSHGDGLAHCHLRYGNQDFDYLTTDPSLINWWPTLFRSEGVNKDEAVQKMVKDAKMYASMLPPVK